LAVLFAENLNILQVFAADPLSLYMLLRAPVLVFVNPPLPVMVDF